MTSVVRQVPVDVYNREYIQSLKEDDMWKLGIGKVIPCPKCGTGEMVYKETKYGAIMGCKNYDSNDENSCDMVMIPFDDGVILPPKCIHHDDYMVLRTNKKDNTKFWGCSHFNKKDNCRYTMPYKQEWIDDIYSHPEIVEREMWIRKSPLRFDQLPGNLTLDQVVGEIYNALHDDYIDMVRHKITSLEEIRYRRKMRDMGHGIFTDEDKKKYEILKKQGPPGYDIVMRDVGPGEGLYLHHTKMDTTISVDEILTIAGDRAVWVLDIGTAVGFRGKRYVRIIRDLLSNPDSDYNIGEVLAYRNPCSMTYYVNGKTHSHREGLRVVFVLNGVREKTDTCTVANN